MTDNNALHYRKAKIASPDNLYADRDSEALGEHFMRHLDRMTVEKLHSKSAIAGELAHRDARIYDLELQLDAEAVQDMRNEIAFLLEKSKLKDAEIAALRQDALRYRWVAQYLPGDDESQDTALIASKTPDEIGRVIDAAMAQAVQ